MSGMGSARALLIVAVVAAAAVRLVTFSLQASWRPLVASLARDPASACQALERTPLLDLPPMAGASRTLRTGALKEAPVECAAAVLRRLASLQQRWLPLQAVGHLNGVRSLLVQDRVEEAGAELEGALLRDPTSPYLHRLSALLKLSRGRYEEALEELALAEGLAPGYRIPTVEVLPGDALWVTLEGFRKRAELYPRRRSEALLALAGRLWRLGRQEEARQVLQ